VTQEKEGAMTTMSLKTKAAKPTYRPYILQGKEEVLKDVSWIKDFATEKALIDPKQDAPRVVSIAQSSSMQDSLDKQFRRKVAKRLMDLQVGRFADEYCTRDKPFVKSGAIALSLPGTMMQKKNTWYYNNTEVPGRKASHIMSKGTERREWDALGLMFDFVSKMAFLRFIETDIHFNARANLVCPHIVDVEERVRLNRFADDNIDEFFDLLINKKWETLYRKFNWAYVAETGTREMMASVKHEISKPFKGIVENGDWDEFYFEGYKVSVKARKVSVNGQVSRISLVKEINGQVWIIDRNRTYERQAFLANDIKRKLLSGYYTGMAANCRNTFKIPGNDAMGDFFSEYKYHVSSDNGNADILKPYQFIEGLHDASRLKRQAMALIKMNARETTIFRQYFDQDVLQFGSTKNPLYGIANRLMGELSGDYQVAFSNAVGYFSFQLHMQQRAHNLPDVNEDLDYWIRCYLGVPGIPIREANRGDDMLSSYNDEALVQQRIDYLKAASKKEVYTFGMDVGIETPNKFIGNLAVLRPDGTYSAKLDPITRIEKYLNNERNISALQMGAALVHPYWSVDARRTIGYQSEKYYRAATALDKEPTKLKTEARIGAPIGQTEGLQIFEDSDPTTFKAIEAILATSFQEVYKKDFTRLFRDFLPETYHYLRQTAEGRKLMNLPGLNRHELAAIESDGDYLNWGVTKGDGLVRDEIYEYFAPRYKKEWFEGLKRYRADDTVYECQEGFIPDTCDSAKERLFHRYGCLKFEVPHAFKQVEFPITEFDDTTEQFK